MEETIYIQACISGDNSAWEKLHNRYRKKVRAFVSSPKWGFTAHEAEEMVQDVFLELFKSLPSFKGEASLSTFLCNIAKNKCVSAMRKKFAHKRAGEIKKLSLDYEDPQMGSISVADKSPTPEESLIQKEEKIKLLRLLGKLSGDCVEAIKLRYFQEYSYDVICKILNLPLGTICSRLSRCLDKLKKLAQAE